MSLKYKCIKETIYNLEGEELKKLKEKIQNILDKRYQEAYENFNKKINELMNPEDKGKERNWRVSFKLIKQGEKQCHILYVNFNNIGYKHIENGNEYRYDTRVKIDGEKMEVNRYPVCTCFSPYSCSNNCEERGSFLNAILGRAIILPKESPDANIKLYVEYHPQINTISPTEEEHVNYLVRSFSLLLFNYKSILEAYLEYKKYEE